MTTCLGNGSIAQSSLLLRTTSDLLGNVFRDGAVLAELHAESCPALGERPQSADVAEHGGERHAGLDDLQVAASAKAVNDAAAGVQIADDASHVLLRCDHLNSHHRFEDDRVALCRPFAERCTPSNLEGHHRGVHRVEGTIDQLGLHIHDREACLNAVHHLCLSALQDARDVLLGDGTTADVVDKLEALTYVGLENHLDLGELAGATRLLLVRVPELVGLGDGLPVGNLRGTNLSVNLELTLEAVHNDLQVQLPHALDHRLVGLLVTAVAERWVLSRELAKSVDHLVGIHLRLWLAGHLDDRLREVHLLQHNGGIQRAKGVTGGGVLEAEKGHDVSSGRRLDFLALVGVHEDHTSKALLLPCPRVEHHLSRLDRSRVNAEESDASDVGIGGNLEGQAGELLIDSILPHELLLLVLGILALGRRQIKRRRQEVDNGIEERLHTLVFEGCATEDRHEAE
mmetsp:Transcript_67763/g.153236  ORF Transcript_67763/g.153236 Transcript_67763/m.153236 type:complete len:457 (-) Transcript_67763:1171-2541(-)